MVREFARRARGAGRGGAGPLRERGIAAGYPLGRDYPEYENCLLVAITERRSRAQIDRLAEPLEEAVLGCSTGSRLANVGGAS